MPSSVNGVYYQNGALIDFYGNPINVGLSVSSSPANYYVLPPPGPTAPTAGTRWYDTSTGYEFVWLTDDGGSQWVALGGPR